MRMISLTNIQNGEEVYQRCVLVTGKCIDDNCVTISTLDDGGKRTFPDQQWPVLDDCFKALLMLAPGNNNITVRRLNKAESALNLTIRYIPLLQTPPLHLAILIAKDSPLLIDCPPSKFPALSDTHSSLRAAIAKFRITALMWQAFTAEEFRLNGLSRRSFRLEEEWTSSSFSTLSIQDIVDISNNNRYTSMSVPKVHLIRTEHTVADLRQADRAQQNPQAKDADSLHSVFSAALKAHGSPFDDGPVTVAGLILDAHFDITQNLILAHAALGAHDPSGLSLGIFGSHLTYAWPRFMEEVTSCLTDETCPGASVGDDNGECKSMWRACAVGQGAFLHEVGHAFGAPHSSGVMMRGYSPDWVKWFVPGTRNGNGNECRWDVRDLLKFKALGAFALPADKEVDQAEPVLEIVDEEDEGVRVKCEAGLGVIMLNGEIQSVTSLQKPVKEVVLKVAELERRFKKFKPLELVVVGMNGKEKRTADVWKFLSHRSWIRVPGGTIRLMKKAVGNLDRTDDHNPWNWAVMLKKHARNGKLVDASKIDVRVGCILDGAIVYYRDGTKVPCGPRGRNGNDDPHMGGHQAKKIAIRKGVEVVKVAVNAPHQCGSLDGLRIYLSDGNARGALNCGSNRDNVHILVPDEGQRIIGFYGSSGGGWGGCNLFGIVTAPKDVELPDSVYDMEELQNKPEGQRANKRRRISREESDSGTEDNCDAASTSEDEDEGYDHASDVDDF